MTIPLREFPGALMRLIFLPCILLLLCAYAQGQTRVDADTRHAILHAQDQRDGTALAVFFFNSDPEVRRMAVRAAGSVQDTNHLPLLYTLLGDSSATVREMVAFALGQMTTVVTESQRGETGRRILALLEQPEPVSTVRLSLIEALGKIGNRESYEALIAYEADLASRRTVHGETDAAEVALTLGRFGYRGITSTSAPAYLIALMQDSPLWQAAYGLMRLGADSLLRPGSATMMKTFASGDADARMFLATALGSSGERAHIPLLLKSADADEDWRVRVNSIKALGSFRHTEARTAEHLLHMASDQNDHVAMTALTVLPQALHESTAPSRALFDDLKRLMNREESGGFRRSGAALALAALFRETALDEIRTSYTIGKFPEADYVRALGFMQGDDSFEELVATAQSGHPQLQRLALDGLIGRVEGDPSQIRHRTQVAGLLSESVSSEDLAVMTTAADAMGDSTFADAAFVQPISRRLATLTAPDDVEPMVSMIETLGDLRSREALQVLEQLLSSSDHTVAAAAAESMGRITGQDYRNRLSTHSEILHADYDWVFLDGLRGATVVVETDRGRFSFEVFPEEAPFTCMSLARLIVSGFYDGLSFHRVVPNFVVQGGDPRGDGWGGPGYTIRSEFGTRSYERGTVGVASAGKDTEGCQFFVTQSKQPHLDGRYTIFGKVKEGMDVVDRLQAGDHILRMTLVH